jgi:rfaE bifunctional protein nucleotidyltransferase chain/domain
MGRVVGVEELEGVRERLRNEGKRVVFTNGCFDIIHRGHVEYLSKAKALGDALIVGVNTDRSVRSIKGPGRPIVEENDRAYILASIVPVDYVCLFDEDTPLNLIKRICPDVLVKGADWNIENVVGKDIIEKAGGHVATIEFIPNRSTSGIIQTIVDRFR